MDSCETVVEYWHSELPQSPSWCYSCPQKGRSAASHPLHRSLSRAFRNCLIPALTSPIPFLGGSWQRFGAQTHPKVYFYFFFLQGKGVICTVEYWILAGISQCRCTPGRCVAACSIIFITYFGCPEQLPLGAWKCPRPGWKNLGQ